MNCVRHHGNDKRVPQRSAQRHHKQRWQNGHGRQGWVLTGPGKDRADTGTRRTQHANLSALLALWLVLRTLTQLHRVTLALNSTE
jgi:hypothetical protein